MRFVFCQIITRPPPFSRYRSTPDRAARVITSIVTDKSGGTGTYYDQKGQLTTGSALARDVAFQDRVLAQTRAFLSNATASGPRPGHEKKEEIRRDHNARFS